ncbi:MULTISPECIES: TraI domain-containing protein [unclassified Pantoea]|uniref:TraI domain-containing protein n=1 Tax=unclassified Pantoea TaxID=2630326 RepID=UPI001CD2E557|nr:MULTISPECIES: TraI domain-containing protein [unclassified Pantoea]MCA1178617.1 helicase/relaxase domain-containing protein [Pantoea sp. alder69]MCA1252035.1 helicase/relaxase domain-containing protein [Pantoea sp. alder70]MCA1267106.1 helicase/relaxase domain-containing protein [Pantoea sp. alder81]
MFPKLQYKLRRSTIKPSIPAKREGYFTPQNYQALLGTPARQMQVKKIWQSSLLSRPLFNSFCLEPLQALSERYQNLPAERFPEWRYSGGLLDLTLQNIVVMMQLAKGMILPANALPEDQSAQSSHWNCLVFWVALYWSVPELLNIEGEFDDGNSWTPLSVAPQQQFRFQLNHVDFGSEAAGVTRLAFTVAMLPKEALKWLETQPEARNCFYLELAGFESPEKQIHDLINKVSDLLIDKSQNSAANIHVNNGEFNLRAMDVKTHKAPLNSEIDYAYEQYFNLGNESLIAEGNVELDSRSKSYDAIRSVGSDLDANQTQKIGINAGGDLTAIDFEACGSSESEQQNVTNAYQTFKPDQESALVTPGTSSQISKKQVGEAFWYWLSEGLENGTIACNEADSRVQLVAGFVFLLVPGIFYRYLKHTGQSADERENVQAGFERLNRHRRNNGKRFTFATLYNSADRNGPYKRVKGYLVKSTVLFQANHVPDDSQFLVVP